MKTILTKILIAFIMGIGMVSILYLHSILEENAEGGFKRNIDTTNVALLYKVDLQSDSWYIAGTSNQHIYLGSTTDPLKILIAANNLSSTHTVTIDPQVSKLHSSRISIDSPYLHVADKKTRALLIGDLLTLKPVPYMKDETFFIDAIPLSQRSIVVRAIDTARQNMLGKQTVFNPYVWFNRTLLQKTG